MPLGRWCSSSDTTSAAPAQLASCSAVHPQWSCAFTSTPARSHVNTDVTRTFNQYKSRDESNEWCRNAILDTLHGLRWSSLLWLWLICFTKCALDLKCQCLTEEQATVSNDELEQRHNARRVPRLCKLN